MPEHDPRENQILDALRQPSQLVAPFHLALPEEKEYNLASVK